MSLLDLEILNEELYSSMEYILVFLSKNIGKKVLLGGIIKFPNHLELVKSYTKNTFLKFEEISLLYPQEGKEYFDCIQTYQIYDNFELGCKQTTRWMEGVVLTVYISKKYIVTKVYKNAWENFL